MHMLRFKDYNYIIKIKDMLNITKPNFWYLIDFFIEKANNANNCFKVFNIKDNWAKNLIKKEILLIVKINLKFET